MADLMMEQLKEENRKLKQRINQIEFRKIVDTLLDFTYHFGLCSDYIADHLEPVFIEIGKNGLIREMKLAAEVSTPRRRGVRSSRLAVSRRLNLN
jgi:hypothetical protein